MSGEAVTLWRCATCGKWSHARVQPKRHQRFIRDDEPEPPAGQVLRTEQGYSSEYEDVHGGWWVKCGPFDEYRAERVSA